ncbi:MAG TPA: DUF2244 domain-containing protein [Steroidobacteraceae bacterium]|nr:DUF2244 domain-containing protein [Steroidobacteraceae bacterium]
MVVSTVEAGSSACEHRIELAPNCSLTPQSARIFVASVAVLTLGTALVFALQGLWPVLPFAGVEVGVLWWAVRSSLRSGRQREAIVISDGAIVVERRGPACSSRLVFPRHWATVKLRDPPVALHPRRLTIESHGRACEVGRFLTEDERHALAVRLRRLVGRTSESPALETRLD